MNERQLFLRLCLITACLMACVCVTGCEDEDDRSDEPAPDDCLRTRPENGTIFIEVTVNAIHSEVPVTVYRGDFEQNQVIIEDVLTSATARYDLAPDVQYAVAARYVVGNDTIFTVGGGKPSIEYEDYADARCWETNDVHLDLRLK